MELPCEMEESVAEDAHDAGGEIRVAPIGAGPQERRSGIPRGGERRIELVRFQRVAAVRLEVQRRPDLRGEPGFATAGQREQATDPVGSAEAEPIAGRRGEEPERMGMVDLPEDLEVAPLAARERRRSPFEGLVGDEDRRLVERRKEVGVGGFGALVVDEEDFLGLDAELLADAPAHPQAIAEPGEQDLRKGQPRLGEAGDLLLEQPLEPSRRLLRERDPVEFARADAGLSEAEAHASPGKARVVLHACEALLGSGRDRHAVLDDRRGSVAMERGEPENPHPYCERRRARGALGAIGVVQPAFFFRPRTARPNGMIKVK